MVLAWIEIHKDELLADWELAISGEEPFTKLKAKELFIRAKVEYGTVVWPGNIDIAPETLWELAQPIKKK